MENENVNWSKNIKCLSLNTYIDKKFKRNAVGLWCSWNKSVF